MWYGIRYSPDRESPIRSEVQEAADMFWTEYLRRNPHVPVDKLSEVGLAQFRRTVSLLAQPKGDPRGGGAAHLGGGGGFYFYYFNNTRYGDLPFANPVNSHWGVGAHENEHLLGQKLSKSNPDFAQGPQGRILRLITFETAPVIAQRLMGLKVLQLATGMKYSGGFQGILKDDFRGPSEYTVFLPTLAKKGEYIQPKNYPSHEMIRILEDGFGITRPGMGQIQKKLNTDLVFQKFMVGQLKMLLARHKKMGAKMYPFQEIRNEALSAFDDK